MKFAFSKPTRNEAEQRMLFYYFPTAGYDGLQLKLGQYHAYLANPEGFRDSWGHIPGGAAALITGGVLDAGGLAHLRRVFAFAAAAGSERVIYCHAVPREGLTDEDIRGFAREFSALGAEGRALGVSFSLHNHFNNPVMYRRDIETFFDAVEEGAVGLTLDTAHLAVSGEADIAGVIRDFADVIDNFHLKDIDGREFKVLGRGTIDFEPVFEAIRDIQYDGWVSTDEESGSEMLDAMNTCYRFMKQGFTPSIRRQKDEI